MVTETRFFELNPYSDLLAIVEKNPWVIYILISLILAQFMSRFRKIYELNTIAKIRKLYKILAFLVCGFCLYRYKCKLPEVIVLL